MYALRPFSPRRLVKPFLLLALAFYLLFHMLSGERGIYALLKEQRRLEVLQQELTRVSAQRALLEQRVQLLSGQALDSDMLDEQARRELGYAAPDEIVILK